MRNYDLHPEAEVEFFAEVKYLLAHSSNYATSFIDDYEKTISLIRAFPNAGSLYDDPIRKISLTDHPFSLFYFISKTGTITILAVMHQSRKPDYWKGRLQDFA